MYTLSSIGPIVPPAVRVSEMVAGDSWHVAVPFKVRVNLTGITPWTALKTLVPSGLIGCWTEALSTMSVILVTKVLAGPGRAVWKAPVVVGKLVDWVNPVT